MEIPEFGGVDPALFRPLKQKITARVDADVLLWLKSKQKYQTYIDRVLRRAMERDTTSRSRSLDHQQ